MAMSQYRVEDKKIQEAWLIFDAVDVLRQIYAKDGAAEAMVTAADGAAAEE